MKALSVKQPWAWLIAQGYKTVENRVWYTSHRGDLLIHASKNKANLAEDIDFVLKQFKIGIDPERLLFGKAVAVVEVVGCTKEPQARIDQVWHERGSFAWILRKARQIEPFETRGKLNLFEVPFSWEEYPGVIREPYPMVMDTLLMLDEPAYKRARKTVPACRDCAHWMWGPEYWTMGRWSPGFGRCETTEPGQPHYSRGDYSCDKFEAKKAA